jgi:hypothetical protein
MKKIDTTKPRIPIGTFNNLVDAYNLAHDTGGAGDRPQRSPIVWPEIKIKNDSGANRGLGAVLKLDSFLLTDKKNTARWFNGKAPTNRIDTFAVLLEPIESGKIGPALVAGVCMAKVNVQNILHRWADVGTTADSLLSYATGAAKILIAPTGTGIQDCMVQLGASYYGVMRGQTDAAIAKGASGTVSIYTAAGVDTGYDVTAANLFANVAISKTVHVWEVFTGSTSTTPVYNLSAAEC